MKSLWPLCILVALAIARPSDKNDYVKVSANEREGGIEVTGPANELVEALESEMHAKLTNAKKWELVKCLLAISVEENERVAMEKETICVLTAFRHSDNENEVEKVRKARQADQSFDKLLEPLHMNQFLNADNLRSNPLAPIQNMNSLIAQFFSTDQNSTAVMSDKIAPLMSGDGEARK